MIYRITVRSNPRILIVAALVVVGPAVGIASFFFSPPIIAIILTAVGAFFSYAFGKFLRQTLRSRIETTEAGLSFDSGAGDRSFFAWEDITLAGRYAEAKDKEYLFIYKEDGDRLITVPNEYERFPQLIAAVAERREVEELTLAPGETLADRLRKRFSTASPTAAEE